MAVTNDLFPQDREDDPACEQTGSSEPASDLDRAEKFDIKLFTLFIRFLALPQPAPPTQSSDRGRAVFEATGCALCLTPVLKTGLSSYPALQRRDVALYSDLAVHRMGQGLADGISQAVA